MNTVVLIAVVLMAVLGLALGVVIGWFAKLFRVETDSRVELVTELLPGANCGGCGKAGCSDFAKSVVAGEIRRPSVRCPLPSRFPRSRWRSASTPANPSSSGRWSAAAAIWSRPSGC